jgi:hypothetical protein
MPTQSPRRRGRDLASPIESSNFIPVDTDSVVYNPYFLRTFNELHISYNETSISILVSVRGEKPLCKMSSTRNPKFSSCMSSMDISTQINFHRLKRKTHVYHVKMDIELFPHLRGTIAKSGFISR